MKSRQLKDTRRHRRFSIDVEARLVGSDGRRLTARTRDVSRSGICLITELTVGRGESLAVELVLAFGDNAFSEPLHLEAHVVWCTPISDAYQVGAMFDDLTDEQDGFLEMFLHYLDGTLAPRGISGAEEDDEEAPTSPDIKDDPFRR